VTFALVSVKRHSLDFPSIEINETSELKAIWGNLRVYRLLSVYNH